MKFVISFGSFCDSVNSFSYFINGGVPREYCRKIKDRWTDDPDEVDQICLAYSSNLSPSNFNFFPELKRPKHADRWEASKQYSSTFYTTGSNILQSDKREILLFLCTMPKSSWWLFSKVNIITFGNKYIFFFTVCLWYIVHWKNNFKILICSRKHNNNNNTNNNKERKLAY